MSNVKGINNIGQNWLKFLPTFRQQLFLICCHHQDPVRALLAGARWTTDVVTALLAREVRQRKHLFFPSSRSWKLAEKKLGWANLVVTSPVEWDHAFAVDQLTLARRTPFFCSLSSFEPVSVSVVFIYFKKDQNLFETICTQRRRAVFIKGLYCCSQSFNLFFYLDF